MPSIALIYSSRSHQYESQGIEEGTDRIGKGTKVDKRTLLLAQGIDELDLSILSKVVA